MFLFNKKKSYASSGILKGFTDRHSHLLPGVDDGIRTLDETLATLKAMEDNGVSTVWLTPHIMEDVPNRTADLRAGFEKLKQEYTGSIELHLAAENMLDNLFVERLEAGDLLTMEDNILLVETSYFNPPYDLDGIIDEIMRKSYRPLLAHPERYRYMSEKDYRRLKQRGVLFQMNLGALVGGYSPETQAKSQYLLKEGFYNFIGSDTHSLRSYNSIISKETLSKSELEHICAIPNHI